MNKPVMVKSYTFDEMIARTTKKASDNIKRFKENGGICLNCGEHPGQENSTLNTMHCEKCNEKTEVLLKKLRGPGFMELKI